MSQKYFTVNQKTILSVDFDRDSTCKQRCPYCYVDTMIRIYPAYYEKTRRNSQVALKEPEIFAKRLNDEYETARNSKSEKFNRLDLVPVRLYGSGDFIPEHLKFIKKLKFKFYVISKNITMPNLAQYIPDLLNIPSLTNLRFSFDNQNINNYEGLKPYYNKDRVGFCYTGLPEDFQARKDEGYKFDVFYNISHKKADLIKSRKFKERCPVDTGELALKKACSYCNKCWRSSTTSNPDWNTFQA